MRNFWINIRVRMTNDIWLRRVEPTLNYGYLLFSYGFYCSTIE